MRHLALKFYNLNQSQRSKILSIIGVFIFLVALIIAKTSANLSWDISKNGQNSLTKASLKLFESLKKPLNLNLYVSLSSSGDSPKLQKLIYKNIVFLQAYARASGGLINLKVLNVKKFGEIESKLIDWGFKGLNTNKIFEKIYFGWRLEFTHKDSGAYILRDLLTSGDKNLEYQLAEDIQTLTNTKKLKIGVLAGIDFLPSFDFQTGRKIPPNPLYFSLDRRFELIDLTLEPQAPVDLLLALGMNFLPIEDIELAQNLIEAGIPTILALDIKNDQKLAFNENNLNMQDFLKKFGILWDYQKLVKDASSSEQVITKFGDLSLSSELILLSAQNFSTHNLLKNIKSILTATASSFSFNNNINYKFSPLVFFSENAELLSATQVLPNADLSFNKQDTNLHKEPKQATLAQTFAGILTTDNSKVAGLELKPEIRLALIGDTDFINPNFWLKAMPNLGSSATGSFYINKSWQDNIFFLENLIDSFAHNKTLVSVRNKHKAPLPFARLEKVRSQSKLIHLEAIKKLEADMQKIEIELADLSQSSAELTSELSPKLAEKKSALLKSRQKTAKNLVDKMQLMQESELALKSKLEFFMVFLAPLIITGAFILLRFLLGLRVRKTYDVFLNQREK